MTKEEAINYLISSGFSEEQINEIVKALERQPVLDKTIADITKFADTIPFNIGEVKAKYRNIGQHDGLEQALEIIEGNIKGDFDIDEWMAENE
jgi:hypothetical protein